MRKEALMTHSEVHASLVEAWHLPQPFDSILPVSDYYGYPLAGALAASKCAYPRQREGITELIQSGA